MNAHNIDAMLRLGEHLSRLEAERDAAACPNERARLEIEINHIEAALDELA